LSTLDSSTLDSSTLDSSTLDLIEVGPRDGLQNEKVLLPTDAKVELVRRSVAAGTRRIEVTSFVSPRAIPALADADEVMAAVLTLPRTDGLRYAGLVANLRGCDRAIEAGVDELDFVLLATDEFSRRNQGMTTAAALELVPQIAERAHARQRTLTVTIGAAFGCPFTGEVDAGHVNDLVDQARAAGADEVSLADTIGVGTPNQVAAFITASGGGGPLRFHFHNTRNTGYANAVAALERGVTALDASTGGIGGCPFAPAATGNIASEDLAYLAARMGYRTGLDLDQLMENALWTGSQLGEQVPGLLSRAGRFG
jgi:hydroxymethylglutaryl-CoA lyase